MFRYLCLIVLLNLFFGHYRDVLAAISAEAQAIAEQTGVYEESRFIATGNNGCITQISKGTKIPILHTVEIIDWYTGGPKPEVLIKL